MTQRRESGRLPLVAVLGLLAAFVVAAPAQAADDTPPTETAAPAAAPDESVERFAPYWSPQWAFFESPPTNPEFEALLRCSPLWGPQRRASSNGRSCFVG